MFLIDRINEWVSRLDLPFVREPSSVVTVLQLRGTIGVSGVGRRSLSMSALEMPIRRAFDKRGLKAVCLIINSPGGSPVQSAQIANRIRQLSEEKGVPVLSFTEDVAASGGYWLALAGDEIYADPMSIIGSVGVISASFGFTEIMNKLGIERRVHTQGEKKAMLDPFSPENPDDVKRLKTIQFDIHKSFKEFVRERRGDALKGSDRTLFNGEIWSGTRALEKGLVDGLGDMRTVVRKKFGNNIRIAPVQRPMGWFRRRLMRMDHVTDGWALDFLAAVEERAWWARFGL